MAFLLFFVESIVYATADDMLTLNVSQIVQDLDGGDLDF